MLSIFKNAYCFYMVQLALDCPNEYELNCMLDRLIDSGNVEQLIDGDDDLKKVFEHVCEYRSYNRCLRKTKPEISGKIVLKAIWKCIF